MAADRGKTTLMIALIVFVMLSFILGVTTYLGFQQRVKEQQAAQAAKGDMEKANRERDSALEEVRRIREVIGTDKDTAEAILAERDDLFNRRFTNFNKDPKSLLRLIEWLTDAIKSKDEDIKRLEAEKVQIRKEQETAVAEANQKEGQARAEKAAAEAELKKVSEDFKTRWTQHEQAQREMKSKQEEALAQATQMRAITEELAKLETLLSPELRRKFAAAAPKDEPEPWPERVRFVNSELRAREALIKDLNQMLAKLRVADKKLQDIVRDATPEDDRIDGFDGRISSVNSLDRTVLILCDSTAGMRPGLTLAVYDPDDPRPPAGSRKGLVEVAEVEGPTVARARIRDDSTTTPILAGDGVATSLWTPGGPTEVVIVGFVRPGSRPRPDAAAVKDANRPLRELVERNGGRIVDAVTPQTTLLIDAGVPKVEDLQAGFGKEWKPADETVRKRALDVAEKYGIRVVSLDGLLDLLGLDREGLDGRRLPSAIGAAP